MAIRSTLLATATLAALITGLATSLSQAGQPITIESDHSQVVILSGVPGSIVIGNPTIADVTVEGNKMFVHGRSFGTTNILAMDLNGNEIAAFDVSVSHLTVNTVALYRGPNRKSYNCAPLCEGELQIGDEVQHFGLVSEQTKTKIELATGTDTAKSAAPPAPQ